jgi:hypothetical protein
MSEPTMADLKNFPALYASSRGVGEVLVGEDPARRLIEACSSGNDTALWSLLSQPQYITTMLDKPHTIYSEQDPRGKVLARPIPNIERTLTVAAQNGHAGVVSALLAFATEHSIPLSDIITRDVFNKALNGGHAAVIEAIGATYPDLINLRIGHGHQLPLYEAVRLRKPDVVKALLELGADPFHPVAHNGSATKLGDYRSSLLSFAAMNTGPRTTAMLLERGVRNVYVRTACDTNTDFVYKPPDPYCGHCCIAYRCKIRSTRDHAPTNAVRRGPGGGCPWLGELDPDALRRLDGQSRCHEIAGATRGAQGLERRGREDACASAGGSED